MSGRGQSSVIGVVLLLGLVLAGATTVVLIGADTLSSVQSTAEVSQAATAMTALDARAGRVALGDSPSATVSMGDAGRNGNLRGTDGGRLIVDTADERLVNASLGSLEYRKDGEVVGYQGGGVWRGTGRNAQPVSPPEFHYRGETLTLPVVVLEEQPGSVGSDQVRLTRGSRALNLGPNAIESDTIRVVVQSRYYGGWATFIEDRSTGSVVEIDHDRNVVVAKFDPFDIDGDFDTGIVALGDVSTHAAGSIDSEVRTDGSVSGDVDCDGGSGPDCVVGQYPDWADLDPHIERVVRDASSTATELTLTGGETVRAGDYYLEELHVRDGELTVDLGAGNVTFYVDGPIGLDNAPIRVVNGTGTDHALRVYTTSDVALAKGNAGVGVESNNATRAQFYGTSSMQFHMGQSQGGAIDGFTGTVYGPRGESASGTNEAIDRYGLPSANGGCPGDGDVCLGTGAGTVRGAIVGGETHVSQSASFTYDSNLTDTAPMLARGPSLPPRLTYMHVSVNTVEVTGVPFHSIDPAVPNVTAPGSTPTPSSSTPTPTPTPTTPTPTSSSSTPTPSASGPTFDALNASVDETGGDVESVTFEYTLSAEAGELELLVVADGPGASTREDSGVVTDTESGIETIGNLGNNADYDLTLQADVDGGECLEVENVGSASEMPDDRTDWTAC